jgi:hypothetical protein
LDELAWLITNLKETITQQSSTIEKQTNIIENVRADHTEIKTKQQNLKRQNAELQEQVRYLQSQISADAASPAPTRPWASIAANRSGAESTQPTPDDTVATDNTLTRHLPLSLTTTDTLYCTIDISRVPDEDANKTSAGAIRVVVEKEIRVTKG